MSDSETQIVSLSASKTQKLQLRSSDCEDILLKYSENPTQNIRIKMFASDIPRNVRHRNSESQKARLRNFDSDAQKIKHFVSETQAFSKKWDSEVQKAKLPASAVQTRKKTTNKLRK